MKDRRKVIRKVIIGVICGALAAGILLGGKSLRDEYYPVNRDPSAEWEPYISTLQAEREAFFVKRDGVNLEAELFIPTGGSAKKAAAVFAPGSGDSLYQDYGRGFVERYILDVFLARDMAVLLVNKRGMGESDGDYTKSSILGRADDINASVQSIQTHPKIDAERIGLIGHSEGGWVVVQAASDNEDIAFVISLVGPATTRMEQAIDMYTHEARCIGGDEEEQQNYLDRRIRMTQFGLKIGRRINFGLLGFDARTMQFDPRDALLSLDRPVLYVYAEHDNLVTPALNIERIDDIFAGSPPENIEVAVIDRATHIFMLVDSPCGSYDSQAEKEPSDQPIEVLHSWLSDQGY